MGLFDKIFGRGATEAHQQPNAQQRFEQLKQKYQGALDTADQQQIQLLNLHVQMTSCLSKVSLPPNRQRMPSGTKSRLPTQVTVISPPKSALIAVVRRAQRQVAEPLAGRRTRSSLVIRSGKISKQFYGDSDEYMRIFYANRDKLNDPNMIQVGQQLTVPPDDNASAFLIHGCEACLTVTDTRRYKQLKSVCWKTHEQR
jgi:hypothetical protein